MTYQLPEPAHKAFYLANHLNDIPRSIPYFTAAQMQAAYAAGVAESKWQPIETAPKDFVSVFDGWNGDRVCDVQWARPEGAMKDHYTWCYSEYENGYGWVNHEAKGLTHWMPLPDAPKEDMSDLSALRGIQGVGL